MYNKTVWIPKDIRERLNLKDGDSIVWEMRGSNITIRKNEEKKLIF
ncbi:MAG: AbrB/MazE/SpoVT family DNA-binding domain-containing protein [Promethearchaeota archaeon]